MRVDEIRILGQEAPVVEGRPFTHPGVQFRYRNHQDTVSTESTNPVRWLLRHRVIVPDRAP
ncbi:MAG: hypothetical protein NVS3B1_18370 [Marmoricola sp.]